MLKQSLLFVSAISVIAVLSLVMLVGSAKLPNRQKNGFTRNFPNRNVILLRQSDTKAPFIQLCAASSTQLFLSVPSPQWLIMLDTNLKTQAVFHIPVPTTEQFRLHSFFVDSPNIYLFVNNVPGIVFGELNGKMTRTVKLATSQFTRSAYISPSTIVVRAFDTAFRHAVFQKLDIQTGKILIQAPLIESNGDFGLSSDGFLTFDTLTHRLAFVEYYSNKILCIDTNLNLLHASKTIDTTTFNPVSIKDVKFKEGNRLMPVTSRATVNSDGYATNGILYIHSALRADNETNSTFNNNAVIDRYEIKTGKYLGSCHIPNLNHETLNSFLIQNGLFFALYKSQIAAFKIAF